MQQTRVWWVLACILGYSHARSTRCDALVPIVYSASMADDFLTTSMTLVNVQIGSTPGLMGSPTVPIVLATAGTAIQVPNTLGEYSHFWADDTDYLYAGCNRILYPEVTLTAVTAPIVPISALLLNRTMFTWSMSLARMTWIDHGWQQYFQHQPSSGCVIKSCAHPFACVHVGAINTTRTVGVQLTIERAGIGLSADLFAIVGCFRLQLGQLDLNICPSTTPVCRFHHCRPSVYELTDDVTDMVLLGMDPLLSEVNLGLAVHWRPDDLCGVVDVAWDETIHLLPSVSHWIFFGIILIVWCGGLALTETDRRHLISDAVHSFTRSDAVTRKQTVVSLVVVRMMPTVGATAAFIATMWTIWAGKPIIEDRVTRGSPLLPSDLLKAVPYIATIAAVGLFAGVCVVCVWFRGAQGALDLFYLPLLLLAFQLQFAGGSVHDWSTYITFAAAVVELAELGRCCWLTIAHQVPWRLTVAAMLVWIPLIVITWTIGLYPMVGTLDQLDIHHALSTSIIATISFMVYAGRVYSIQM